MFSDYQKMLYFIFYMKCDKHAKNEEIRKGAIQEYIAVCFLIASEPGRSKVLTGVAFLDDKSMAEG